MLKLQPNDPGIGFNLPATPTATAGVSAGTIDEIQELTPAELQYLNETQDRVKRQRMQTVGEDLWFGSAHKQRPPDYFVYVPLDRNDPGKGGYDEPRWHEPNRSTEQPVDGFPQSSHGTKPTLVRKWTSALTRYAKNIVLFPFVCVMSFILYAIIQSVGAENLDPNQDVGGQDD